MQRMRRFAATSGHLVGDIGSEARWSSGECILDASEAQSQCIKNHRRPLWLVDRKFMEVCEIQNAKRIAFFMKHALHSEN